ncbi:MAG: hypothetical protein JF628_14615 [Sphingomonas sp.]|nr:hypothetical protein [Sphingomonas sp.]
MVAVDLTSGGVADRIAVSGRPRGMAFSPDHATLYVALSAAPDAGDEEDEDKAGPARIDGVAAIDVASARVLRVLPAGKDPVRVAISRDGRTLFAADQADGAVTEIATDGSGRPRTIAVCETPEGLAIASQ